MSNASFGWICLLLVIFIPVIDARSSAFTAGANRGMDCAICSGILGLVDKLTIVHNKSAEQALEMLCSFLPTDYKLFCKSAVAFLGKFI